MKQNLFILGFILVFSFCTLCAENNSENTLDSKDNKSLLQEYTVQRGDTLYKIAKEFNTSISGIQKMNNMTTTDIKAGQKLKVPQVWSIDIRLSDNKLILNVNNNPFKTYNVYPGAFVPDSFSGAFKIYSKQKDPAWRVDGHTYQPDTPGNIIGSRWIALKGIESSADATGTAIHGTNKAGTPDTASDSPGYFRMSNADINELYELVPEETIVRIIPLDNNKSMSQDADNVILTKTNDKSEKKTVEVPVKTKKSAFILDDEDENVVNPDDGSDDMDTKEANKPSYLHEQALQCRQMAKQAREQAQILKQQISLYQAQEALLGGMQYPSLLGAMPYNTDQILTQNVELFDNLAEKFERLDEEEKSFFADMKNTKSRKTRTDLFIRAKDRLQSLRTRNLEEAEMYYLTIRRAIMAFRRSIAPAQKAEEWVRFHDDLFNQYSIQQMNSIFLQDYLIPKTLDGASVGPKKTNQPSKMRCPRCGEEYYFEYWPSGLCPKCSAPNYSF